MPLPALVLAHAFEQHFETAAAARLNAVGAGQAFVSAALAALPPEVALPDTRISTMFTVGVANEYGMDGEGEPVPIAYFGVLEVGISTRREDEQAGVSPGVMSMHAEFAARARVAFLARSVPFGQDFPYGITEIRPGQSDRTFDAQFFEDYTTLRFDVRFSLPESLFVSASG
jgi:hypothetical protein